MIILYFYVSDKQKFPYRNHGLMSVAQLTVSAHQRSVLNKNMDVVVATYDFLSFAYAIFARRSLHFRLRFEEVESI